MTDKQPAPRKAPASTKATRKKPASTARKTAAPAKTARTSGSAPAKTARKTPARTRTRTATSTTRRAQAAAKPSALEAPPEPITQEQQTVAAEQAVEAAAPDRRARNPLADLAEISKSAPTVGLLPMLLILGMISVDRFDNAAFGILGPEIRQAFDLSNSQFLTVSALANVLPTLLTVYVGFLSDRMNRVNLMRIGGLVGAITALLTGFAPALIVLVVVRLASGVGQTVYGPTQPSLLSDYYPPMVLATVFSVYQFANNAIGLVAGPVTGGLTALFGWRATFIVLSVPIFVLVILTARLKEPERGLSAGLQVAQQNDMGFLESFRQLRGIRSVRRIWLAAVFFGGGVVAFGSLQPLFFQDVFDVGPGGRGVLSTIFGAAGLVGISVGGRLAQNRVRTGDLNGLAIILGAAIVVFGAAMVLLAAMPVLWLAVVALCIVSFGASAFGPSYQTIVAFATPPKLRGQAFAWVLMFVALGALVVAPTIGSITDSLGNRRGMALLGILVVVCGVVAATTRRFVARDVSAAQKVSEISAVESTGLLTCRGVEVAYDEVQILFGVDLDVQQGEILALLGTNGAGKSTLLKAISGLVDPRGGAILFDGQDITHADPAKVTSLGIAHIPGGRGIFPGLTVAENLRTAGWMYRGEGEYRQEAVERVLQYFPVLRERWEVVAGSMSGGEQQMLSLGMAFIARPRLLMIDELSLGLAPAIVDSLLEIVQDIHANGATVILVEQSVNTALRIAKRAVFMEKGEVRFFGSTEELLKRPDVLRAVFLEGSASAVSTGQGAAGSRRRGAKTSGAPDVERAVVLETRDLTKRYGGITANDAVSIVVHADEIVGLIGPNGAGKTSLFDVISGLAVSDGGSVHLLGSDVTTMPPHRRSTRGLARSFQDSRLWPSLTVREAIAVSFEHLIAERSAIAAVVGIAAVSEAEADVATNVDELLELLGLQAFRDKFISELSTGSKRIVEIAATMAQRPAVLLLDEPSSGIAQRETEQLLPFLRGVREQLGCGMLVIEHDMNLITGLADRIYALDQGAVIAEGTPDEIVRNPRVVASYLGSMADELQGRSKPRRRRTARAAQR